VPTADLGTKLIAAGKTESALAGNDARYWY